MSIKYPAAIDNIITVPIVKDNITNLDAKLLNTWRNAIITIESELGTNPSGMQDSVKSRLDAVDVSITNILNSLDMSGVFVAGGDLSGTSTNQTVIGLQGTSVSSVSPNDGDVLKYNQLNNQWEPGIGGGSASIGTFDSQPSSSDGLTSSGSVIYAQSASASNPGMIKLSGDISGTSSSPTVISLTGSAGSLNIASTAANFVWDVSTVSPTIKQNDNISASATATNMTLSAQNATGATSNGGNLYLSSGSGTSNNGYVEIQSGGNNIIRCLSNKIISNVGKRIKTNIKTSNYLIDGSDDMIIVGALSSPITLTLPASASEGDVYFVKDQSGSASTYNIIIDGNGSNIDGFSTYTINANYQSIGLIFSNSSWGIF